MPSLRKWTCELKLQTLVVYFAARDRRTPRLARVLALGIAAYALSPVDLIPDFIPVLGLLDDLVIVPLGLMLVLRLIAALVAEQNEAWRERKYFDMDAFNERAEAHPAATPSNPVVALQA